MSDWAREYLRNALLAEKAELLAKLPRTSARRAAVIRGEVAACDSLLRRFDQGIASAGRAPG